MTQQPTQAQVQQIAQHAEGLLRSGKPLQAARALAPIMQQARSHLPAALTFARSLMLIGQHAQSAEVFAHIVKHAPAHAAAATEYAAVLARLARFDEAISQVRRARESKPWFGPAVFLEADLLADTGRGTEAVQLLDAFEKQSPASEQTRLNSARLLAARARLIPKHVHPESIIDDLLAMASDDALSAELRCILNVRAAGALDLLGRYDEAFELQTRAKAIRNLPWDGQAHTERMGQCINAWSSDEAQKQPRASTDGSGLVFIVGMPRSGSSLLEQMLSCHPKIGALGERNEITQAAQAIQPTKAGLIPLVTDLSRLTPEVCAQLAQSVSDAYEAHRLPGIELLTDKQPFNFAQLPLLARLLPGCKAIHIRRDPRDTCLSYFMQWMLGAHPQTNTIDDLARFHRDQLIMMDAWSKLPSPEACPEMIEIEYEALVSDPEPVLRRITDFLAIDFDDAMLDHTASDRITNTASRDQVRSGLYTSRIARWKHYEKHLGPVMEYLADFIED